MFKRTILVLLGFAFLFVSRLAYAEVVINEIQLNPTEERFIELYNSNSSSVDLTGWYIQRKTQTGSSFNSLVSKTYFENKTIGVNGYFLISKDTLGLNTFTLTESNTIQLKNLNQEVMDKSGWGDGESSVVDNPPDGKSIQRVNNEWVIASPTPGTSNSSSSVNDSSNTESNTNDDNFSTQDTTETESVKTTTIKAKILTDAIVFAGQPFEIENNVFGYSNENIVLGRAYWNFGDGGSFEQINNFEKFYHIYYYPGEYVLFLEYYSNNTSRTPETTSKMIIKVLPTTVTISKVGSIKDFFIELSNNASSDIDISNWILRANEKTFMFPKNSVIMSKKQMIISDKISGFSFGDKYNLKLFSSTGELVFSYSSSIKSVKTLAQNSIPLKTPITESVEARSVGDLEAAVVKSDVGTEDNLIYGISLFAFLGISASAAYFVRTRNRKAILGTAGNDFEIIDE